MSGVARVAEIENEAKNIYVAEARPAGLRLARRSEEQDDGGPALHVPPLAPSPPFHVL